MKVKMKIVDVPQIQITSKFGVRKHPVTGAVTNHNGIDISTPIGTPVRTPVAAEVTNCYDDKTYGGGITVILRDIETNERYGFCHLQEYSCHRGEILQKGEVFAKTGNSGKSTGPHLHFSYAKNCQWIGNQVYKMEWADPTDKVEFEL